jgi:hypothetical protein
MPTTADIFQDRCAAHGSTLDQAKVEEEIASLGGEIYDGDFDPLENGIEAVHLVFIKFPDGSKGAAGNYGKGWFAKHYRYRPSN